MKALIRPLFFAVPTLLLMYTWDASGLMWFSIGVLVGYTDMAYLEFNAV